MITIKKYFLGILLLSFVNSFTMEVVDQKQKEEIDNIDQYIEPIRSMIDIRLGVNIDSFFRPLVGSIMSYYEATFLSPQTIHDEIDGIEYCLKTYPAIKRASADTKQKLLNTLSDRHWYVYYLINASVKEKVKELDNALTQAKVKDFDTSTRSKLLQLLNPNFTDDVIGIKKLIHHEAEKAFIKKSETKDAFIRKNEKAITFITS